MYQEPPRKRGRPPKSDEGITARADIFFRRFSEKTFSDKEKFVMEGARCHYLLELIKMMRINSTQMEQLLLLNVGALSDRGKDELFSQIVSDRILAILELYSFGVEIMGTFELFNEWMKKPSEHFIFHRPIDIIITHAGLLEVRRVLNEVKTGHY